MLREMIPVFDRLTLARDPLARFEREMDKMMESLTGRRGGWEAFEPRMNLAETEKEFEVTVELPGLKAEEVRVEVMNGELWISGERKEEKEEKGKTWHRIERRYGEFRRVVPLPTAVEEGKVEARFEGGLLKVVLPKTEEAKPRHIAVKVT
jgi:HSP20 family protein